MAEYLSKETLQEKLNRKKAGPANKRYTEGWNDAILMVKSMIHSEKAADVAPVRHAYWVPEEHADQVSPTTIHRYTWYYCSECGRRLIGYKNPVDAPYCHCGCRMDLEG